MRKIFGAMAIMAMMLISVNRVSAQEAQDQKPDQGFHFDFFGTVAPAPDPTKNLGNVFGLRQDAAVTPIGTNLNNSVSNQPLDVPSSRKFFGAFSMGWMSERQIGFGGSFQRTSSSGTLPDIVVTSPSTSQLGGCNMWDTNINPLRNQFGRGGRSPVTCGGSSSFGLTRFDGEADWDFARGNAALAGFKGNIAFVSSSSSKEIHQVQQGYDPDHLPQFSQIQGLSDDVTWKSDAEIKTNLVGVGGGVYFHAYLNRLHFTVRANETVGVWQRSTATGNWSAHEQFSVVHVSNGVPTQGQKVSDVVNQFPLGKLPDSDARVRIDDFLGAVGFRLFKCLEIGVAYYTSRYNDLPVAPSWSVPFAGPLQSGAWKPNTANVTISNIGGWVQWRFGETKKK